MKTTRSRHLGHLLRNVQLGMTDDFNERMSRFGLSQNELALLNVLAEQLRVRQSDLARRLELKPGNLSLTLDALTYRSLVLRERDPNDARVMLVGLSPEGRRLVQQANRAMDRQSERLREVLGEQEHARLVQGLTRLGELLGRAGTIAQGDHP